MTCGVCGAPALSLHGACPFCRSPLSSEGEGDPLGLVDYLASSLPGAAATRGVLGHGRLRDVRVAAGGVEYRARLRGEALELEPPLAAANWVDSLLASMTADARHDPEARALLSHLGWAWR